MGILTFICYLMVAALCAYIAKRVMPADIPGGFATSTVAGAIGAWIGGSLLGHFGPDLAGVALLPSVLCSAILVFGLSFLTKECKRSRA